MAKQTPMIFRSDLTGRWFVATRYRARPEGGFEAREKFDITDQIEAILKKPPTKSKKVKR